MVSAYTEPMPHSRARRAPVWLMGLSNATIGLAGGFIVLPLPQLLAAQGVPELKIAAVSAACLSPGFFVFLLGPLLDIRFTRRFYATSFAALAGLALMSAVFLRAHLLTFEILVMVAYASSVLSSNALGGWLSGVIPEVAAAEGDAPNHEGAKLSAWTQVGLFLGNGLMAGLAAEGMRRLPPSVIAPLLGLIVILPAAVFPWIPVQDATSTDTSRSSINIARDGFRQLFTELRLLLRRPEVILTLLLFTAPTGSFALTNQLGGIAQDFHASPAFVGRMGGLILSFAGATSCLLLPLLARWIKPLPLYLLIGTVGSVFTLSLLAMPRTATTFSLAFMGENVVQALSFTAAVAICFATIGRNNPLAATQFSLLTSATVIPILYMGVLDGRVYGAHGLSRMYLVDGGLSLIACILMALLLFRYARQPNLSSFAS